MRIICPHCGFSKKLASDQIPANVIRVTCPSCRQPFPLTRELTEESVPTIEDSSTETVMPTPAAADRPQITEPGSNNTETASAEEVPVSKEPVESFVAASIGTRYAALMLDSMLILIMIFALRAGLTLLGNGIQFEGKIILSLVFALFALTLGFAYHTLFIGVCGQTPGKRLMRIQVISIDSSPISWAQATLREVLGKTLSSTFLLGYIMALFHPQRLAAHDKIADTCVVKLHSNRR